MFGRTKRDWSVVVWLGVWLVAAPAFASVVLTSIGGLRFDIEDTTTGSMTDGGGDAYDGCYFLSVNGTSYNAAGASSTTTLAGRNVVLATTTMGTLRVYREVFVPETGGDFARYLDVLENPTTDDAMATLAMTGNLGSDGSTMLVRTSSGDALLTASDTWFATDDADGTGDPSLAHVVQGTGAPIMASVVSLTSDSLRAEFSVSIPAGGRIALLTFAVQKRSRADAEAEAQRLADLPDDVLDGLDDILSDIVNFPVPLPGAPIVRFMGPSEVDEGATATLEVAVEDLEGDPVTFSWDTDQDGVFGELEGMRSHSLVAGDGPRQARLAVRASDGTLSRDRYWTMSVRNVAPEIMSTPPVVTSVGANLRYVLEIAEPAGDADPLTYRLLHGPPGMSVEDGSVTWSPTADDITDPGNTIPVEVSVSDDDGGADTQSWGLSVSPNRVPTPPQPIFPIAGVGLEEATPRLVVGNSADDDRDPLTYFFQIDRGPSFDTAGLRESGAIEETPGYSFWQLDVPLPAGRYFWRSWAHDGIGDGEAAGSFFFVLPGTGQSTDAGNEGPNGGSSRSNGGCSLTPPAARRAHSWGLLLLLLPAFWVLRRRPSRGMAPWVA